MVSLLIALLVFGLVYGAAMTGLALQRRLPADHLEAQSKEAVQLVMGLVATMAALVLSLLIASSHAFFETQQEEVQKLARDVVLLDESLARYGAETKPLRTVLREDVLAATQTRSPDEGVGSATITVTGTAGQKQRLFAQVLDLQPQTAAQRFDQSKALELMTMIASTRLLIHEQSTSSVPAALVVVMVIWLTLLFAGFGLFARPNATVRVALALGAFSVAGAIFLILDMSHPYRGLIHVSGVPIESALDQIGH